MSEIQKTKTELLSEMRELQQKYSNVAAILKELSFAEEKARYEKRQLERLEQYKAKYKLYVTDDGSLKEIDHEDLEKLVTTSFQYYGDKGSGYSLGFISDGTEGLESGNTFTPMVEDEDDGRRYIERQNRIKEFKLKFEKK